MLHQLPEIFITHLCGDAGIAQKAAVNCQSRVQRVQTGSHLHPLRHIDRISVSQVHACLFKNGTAVGESVFHYEILRNLRIDKGGDIGVPAGDNRGHILNPCL